MHGVEFLSVASFLEQEKLHLIIESLEKLNYICFIDAMPTVFDYQKSADGCPLKMPIIFFFEPSKYEGCEFPVVLILMNKSYRLKTPRMDENFLTAIRRASLNLVIIVDDFSLTHAEELKRKIASEHSKIMEEVIN